MIAGCIHVGLPKTATSLLQANLFPHHSQIEYLGKFCEGRSRFRDSAVRAIIMDMARGNVFEPDRDRCRSLFLRTIAPAAEAGKVPLWSSEDLTAGSPRRRRARAENFRAVFGDCRVILTLRHPVRFVESMYLYKLKAANVGPEGRLGTAPRYFRIDQWLGEESRRPEKGALTHLEYAQTIEMLAGVFGRESIGVFLFEQLVEDAPGFLRALCEFIGIDPDEGIRLTAGKRRNDRWTSAELDRFKAVERSTWRSTAFRFAPRSLRERMLRRNGADDDPPARAHLPSEWRERIARLTGPGNRWLAERWSLPLDRYDYPF